MTKGRIPPSASLGLVRSRAFSGFTPYGSLNLALIEFVIHTIARNAPNSPRARFGFPNTDRTVFAYLSTQQVRDPPSLVVDRGIHALFELWPRIGHAQGSHRAVGAHACAM